MSALPEIPHVAWPFRRGRGGKVAVVEQDTLEHIQSCEWAIVVCPTGFRQDRPEFGWDFPTFRTMPISPDALREALRAFEPRGRSDVAEWFDVAEAAVENFRVEIQTADDTGGSP